MEIAKTEKFDLSTIRVGTLNRSPLTTRVTNLEVGEGFTVEGIDRADIQSRAYALRPRRYVISKLALNKYRIVRVT